MFICIIVYLYLCCCIYTYITVPFTVDSSKPHTINQRERECERGEHTRDKANQTNVHTDTNTVPWLNESNETISIREKQNQPNAVSSLNVSCCCYCVVMAVGTSTTTTTTIALCTRTYTFMYIHTSIMRIREYVYYKNVV